MSQVLDALRSVPECNVIKNRRQATRASGDFVAHAGVADSVARHFAAWAQAIDDGTGTKASPTGLIRLAALNPAKVRAHHLMAPAFRMTARPAAGILWLNGHVTRTGVDTSVDTHGHFHLALFHLARGKTDRRLALYDRCVRRGHSTELAESQARPTRHGLTTRKFGLSDCRALAAFGRGDDNVAITLLAGRPAQAHRIGGSQAQRSVLELTLQRAIERVRRPVERAKPERQVCIS